MHSKKLTELLSRLCSGEKFGQGPKLEYYADLVSLAASPGTVPHRSAGKGAIPENAFPIKCRTLEKRMGRGGFERLNTQLGCLEFSNNWSVENNETRAYWISPSGRKAIELACREAANDPSYLVDESGRRLRRRDNALLSRDSNDNNAASSARIRWAVPVNMAAITTALDSGVDSLFKDLDQQRRLRVEDELRSIRLAALSHGDALKWGEIPQVYRECPSGRLCGRTFLSLQNVTREAKWICLNGAHEYDFENCHFNILKHVATAADIETPVINQYVADARGFREWLSREAGISYQDAKEGLLKLLYGARVNTYPGCTIAGQIGPEAAVRFFEHPLVSQLLNEVRQVGEWMVETARRHPRSNDVINCRGKTCQERAFNKELAHLLQGIESELLHVIIEHQKGDFLVLQHDGFTTSEFVEPEFFEQLITEETGFSMPVTYQRLELAGLPLNALENTSLKRGNQL